MNRKQSKKSDKKTETKQSHNEHTHSKAERRRFGGSRRGANQGAGQIELKEIDTRHLRIEELVNPWEDEKGALEAGSGDLEIKARNYEAKSRNYEDKSRNRGNKSRNQETNSNNPELSPRNQSHKPHNPESTLRNQTPNLFATQSLISEDNEFDNRKTQSYRHVHLDRVRPSLSKEEGHAPRKEEQRKRGSRSHKIEAFGMAGIKKSPELKVIPLGGLDAIGKNMTVFECGDDLIIDDAGLMFPDDSHPGIDLILPDYTYVLENAHKLRGIIITHGHEDHTGALPYLLKDLDQEVCIYATKLTLGLIEIKLEEHRVKNVKLIEISSGQNISLGCFRIEFFAVNHSIPGAVGLFLESPAGTVLHMGDFKLDQTPIDGVTTDFGAMAKFGARGVDLMLSDSTNAMNEEFTPSEAEVGKVLLPIMAQAKGKIVIASFASHIHRMQQICDVAVACGRKVAVTGRSMIQNTDIARKLGYLSISDNHIIDAYELDKVPPQELVVLCTGSQGEPLSALARISKGGHKTISLDAGDTVIISATPVPGNEKAVTKVINGLAKLGVDVYDKKRAMVHVSGHAGSQELKIALSIVNPKYFLPVHGEASHLRAHAQLAVDTGIDERNIFICENGETLLMKNGQVSLGEPVQSGIVFVDGLSVGDTSQKVLDERSGLASSGVAFVSAAVSLRKRSVLGNMQVNLLGIAGSDETFLHEAVQMEAMDALVKSLRETSNKAELNKSVRDAVRGVMREATKSRPHVIVNLIDI